MRVIDERGNPELARVFIGEMDDSSRVEFVESVQPPRSRQEKWVNIISTMVGCPVGCRMCDAGGGYTRALTVREMLWQLDTLADTVFGGMPDTGMWKIQLARMGEPTLNPAVLGLVEELAGRGHGNMVLSLSTIAPSGCAPFIQELAELKDGGFRGRFQLQFSIHSTDDAARRRLIPARCLTLPEIAALGRQFRSHDDRKVTLNFIIMDSVPVDAQRIARIFDPDNFLVKLTPLNPTYRAMYHNLRGGFDPERPETAREIVDEFRARGFEVILSIGELEENNIGSNCGQYVQAMERAAGGRPTC